MEFENFLGKFLFDLKIYILNNNTQHIFFSLEKWNFEIKIDMLYYLQDFQNDLNNDLSEKYQLGNIHKLRRQDFANF